MRVVDTLFDISSCQSINNSAYCWDFTKSPWENGILLFINRTKYEMNKIISLLFIVISICNANAQIKIKGVVKNQNNIGVEYATVCVDSVYILTDRNGLFSLELPTGVKGDMLCTHISYKKK